MRMASAEIGTLRIGDREVRYRVRYSRKARRLSLRIDPRDGLEVIVPVRAPHADIERLVAEKISWVTKKMRDFERLKAVTPEIALRSGAHLTLAGRDYTIRLTPSLSRRPRIALDRGELVLFVPADGDAEVRVAFRRWLVRFAHEVIRRRVDELSAVCGTSYSRITVRSQKGRWGSCSRRGTLSFNWRLILLPPGVMDYLIYHELAHLRHMNHGRRFWIQVERWCPLFRDMERWLKAHGPLVISQEAC